MIVLVTILIFITNLVTKKRRRKIMNFEEIRIKAESLNVGDIAVILTSEGDIKDVAEVTGEINNYLIIKGDKYWKNVSNGKHRKRGNIFEFAMTVKEAIKYIPKRFKYKIRVFNLEKYLTSDERACNSQIGKGNQW